ncbi:MAG: type II toxin-antitoxin system PemK/MazF family toxin [Lachnospiraceae bacterium]|jgi:mRNA-degrading endonuclease toxin of MazEF toxin-antitoxin module|nr:type II toxin-antitoxin system PemK/MazF family toxin [Lachnospiraceae bacterium]
MKQNSQKKQKEAKGESDITIHKDVALQKLNNLMTNYISNSDTADKADKLAYWLEDYTRLLNFEKDFQPSFLKKYSRGDIIKVNLGYNVGNEEGGLHYCVVIDKNNSKESGIVTVVPLTSDKGKPLHFSEVPLGNEIYTKLNEKCNAVDISIAKITNSLAENKENFTKQGSFEIYESLELLKTYVKITSEMEKMKKGSIAMVSQITTISKQRIYDPQKNKDILSGLRISNESLDLINDKIKQLFIKT